MNRVLLIGRLTAKPELRYTGSNIAYSRFSIAVNRQFSNSEGEKETDFFNIVAWKKQAENVCRYLDKGSLAAIEGRLQQDSYEDKDGKRQTMINVVADNVQFLESKKIENSVVENKKVETDPFAEMGEQVSLDDNFLD